MKILCRFCEFEIEGSGKDVIYDAISHIESAHPEKAKEMLSGLFNLMKEYYITQR